jgi:tetratricopeptide (TPR) repeat protein
LAELARFEFYTGHFRRAELRLHQAQRLIPSLTEHRELEAANLTWVQAHLDRTRDQSDLALLPAIAVSEVYSRLAPPVSQDRIHVFVAATALDIAAKVENGPSAINRAPFLLLARSHLARTDQLVREAHDRHGRVLAQVMRARYNLLSGHTADRIGALEKAIQMAQRLEDEALLAEGLTALGDEFAARGERESALNCYRQVLQALDGSQIPALGTFAQRALLRDQESHV